MAPVHCPLCGEAPLPSHLWLCHDCGAVFDTFLTSGRCPKCGLVFMYTECGHSRSRSLLEDFLIGDATGQVEPLAPDGPCIDETASPPLRQVSIQDPPTDAPPNE